MGSTVTMRQMLEAGVHFGHQTRYWSPKMSPYIFGERNKIHIINLEKTLPLYNDAVNFLGKLASRGGQILMVGTKRAAGDIIRERAQECECPYVNHRWLGGMLTNFKTVRNSVNRLNELDTLIEEGGLDRVNKKEGLSIQRERDKLHRSLSGIRNMASLPDALLIVDVDQESIAVKEANRLGIPVVAVVDTNSSTDGVDYIIPGNDDSIRAIELYLSGICEAIKAGKQTAKTIGNVAQKYDVDDTKAGLKTAETKKAAKTVTKKKVTKTVVKKVIKSSSAIPAAGQASDKAEDSSATAQSESVSPDPNPVGATGDSGDDIPGGSADDVAQTSQDDSPSAMPAASEASDNGQDDAPASADSEAQSPVQKPDEAAADSVTAAHDDTEADNRAADAVETKPDESPPSQPEAEAAQRSEAEPEHQSDASAKAGPQANEAADTDDKAADDTAVEKQQSDPAKS